MFDTIKSFKKVKKLRKIYEVSLKFFFLCPGSQKKPWIRIRIDKKCWIRIQIRIETYADPHH